MNGKLRIVSKCCRDVDRDSVRAVVETYVGDGVLSLVCGRVLRCGGVPSLDDDRVLSG